MKYIIEIKPEYEDTTKGIMVLGARDGNTYYDMLAVEDLEELNSDYINEHFGDLQDTAYQRGLEDGKAVNDKGCEGCKFEGNPSDNPCKCCSNGYPNQWTAEQTDNCIEIGDEVEVLNSGSKYLIAWFAGTSLCGFAHDGVTCRLQPSDVRKTGRHFDIASILNEMQSQ